MNCFTELGSQEHGKQVFFFNMKISTLPLFKMYVNCPSLTIIYYFHGNPGIEPNRSHFNIATKGTAEEVSCQCFGRDTAS